MPTQAERAFIDDGGFTVIRGSLERVHGRSAIRNLALLAGVVALGVVGALGVPQAGAAGADVLRAVFGDRIVALMEDTVYGTVDRVQRLRHVGDRPLPRWSDSANVRTKSRDALVEPAFPAARRDASVPERFRPSDVGPLYADFAAPGDGQWRAVDASPPDGSAPAMYETWIHPDRERSFSELVVVAIDVRATELHFVVGTSEPENVSEDSKASVRSGRIPIVHRASLLAAFNGGFKTRHGRHGVQVDGVTFVPPRDGSCTILRTDRGDLRIGTLSRSAISAERPSFFRQTTRCLVENGILDQGLSAELTATWGASVSGQTVIRRSAIGSSADRHTLFVGIGNHVTAAALARGMRHAGANVVAQLDVNEAFPRFLTYVRSRDGERSARPIIDGLVYEKGQYVAEPSSRDFFYVTRRSSERAALE